MEKIDRTYLKKHLRTRDPGGNKGTFGHVLAVAGSKGMAGAAYLCGMASYRAGAGLVRILTPEENREILQILLPEAILSFRPIGTGGFGHDFLDALAEYVLWSDAVVIGPGLGTSEAAEWLLSLLVREPKAPLVLDADALNLLAKSRRPLPLRTVLTPHIGEMARLTGKKVAEIKQDPAGAARALSKELKAVVVLKDADTVVVLPSGDAFRWEGKNSGMATGGSGDVLSGVIGGLLSQGYPPEEAALCGVVLHGLAGEAARERCSAHGMTARDILEGTLEVWKNVERA